MVPLDREEQAAVARSPPQKKKETTREHRTFGPALSSAVPDEDRCWQQKRLESREGSSNARGERSAPIAAAANYGSAMEAPAASGRWQWSGCEGVAPWVEERESFVQEEIDPEAVEEAEVSAAAPFASSFEV